MLSFLFKLVVTLIVILILLQLEYNGRKIQTYVTEYFKSLKGQKETVYIQEDPVEKKAVPEKQAVAEKKDIAHEKKVVSPKKKIVEKKSVEKTTAEPKKIKIVKQKADDQPEVTEEDRKELQQMLQ
jgi:hypothetical protein